MKCRFSIRIAEVTLFASLANSFLLVSQERQDNNHRHHHYKLIDMGTFGGSASCINEPSNFVSAINAHGSTVGTSGTAALQTSASNPTAINCSSALNIFHAFEWHNGALTDLGTLAGQDFNSDADSINDNGVVEGISENGLLDPALGFNQVRAVIWRGRKIEDLGTFEGLHSWSFGINNRDQVVGMALNAVPDPISMYGLIIFGSSSSTQTRAFLWQRGEMQDLGTLGGPDAWAWAINQRGQVLGWSYTNSKPNPGTGFPTLDAFIWEHGRIQDLGSLGGVVGFPVALNNRGQAIGGSSTASNPTACWVPSFTSVEFGDPNCHPFLWDRNRLIDLNVSSHGASPLSANAINNAGQIIGAAAFDAYLWNEGTVADLGHLTGDCYITATLGLSMAEVRLLGDSFSCGSTFQHAAFLWENGSLVDLNNLIPHGSSLQLVFGTAINDRGEIAGDGVPPGVSPSDVFSLGHAFLLIPCDENHPGIEDCDYSLVEADAPPIGSMSLGLTPVTSNQSYPRFHGMGNAVVRRLAGRLVP